LKEKSKIVGKNKNQYLRDERIRWRQFLSQLCWMISGKSLEILFLSLHIKTQRN